MKIKLVDYLCDEGIIPQSITIGKIYEAFETGNPGVYHIINDENEYHTIFARECEIIEDEPQEPTKQYVLVSRMGYKDYVGTLEEILEYASDNNVDILQERVFELGEEVKLKVVVDV